MMFSEIILTHDCISFKLLSQLEPHYLHSDVQGKEETIHHMYRNRDYFGDGSVHDTWRPLTIQTI